MAERYRKKPVEVEAVCYRGPDNLYSGPRGEQRRSSAVTQFMGENYSIRSDDKLLFWIEKSQATATISPGDWIIAELDGVGFYPCAAGAFDATYELVSDAPTSDSGSPEEPTP